MLDLGSSSFLKSASWPIRLPVSSLDCGESPSSDSERFTIERATEGPPEKLLRLLLNANDLLALDDAAAETPLTGAWLELAERTDVNFYGHPAQHREWQRLREPFPGLCSRLVLIENAPMPSGGTRARWSRPTADTDAALLETARRDGLLLVSQSADILAIAGSVDVASPADGVALARTLAGEAVQSPPLVTLAPIRLDVHDPLVAREPLPEATEAIVAARRYEQMQALALLREGEVVDLRVADGVPLQGAGEQVVWEAVGRGVRNFTASCPREVELLNRIAWLEEWEKDAGAWVVPLAPWHHRRIFPDLDAQFSLLGDAEAAGPLVRSGCLVSGRTRPHPGMLLLFVRNDGSGAIDAAGLVESATSLNDVETAVGALGCRSPYSLEGMKGLLADGANLLLNFSRIGDWKSMSFYEAKQNGLVGARPSSMRHVPKKTLEWLRQRLRSELTDPLAKNEG